MANSDPLLAQARASDPHRALAVLFAPAERRGALLALLLLNQELARIPALVSQPMPGLIRCQWWRDALAAAAEGCPPKGEKLAQALAGPLAAGEPPLAELERLIDAREADLEPQPLAGTDDHVAYAAARSGQLHVLLALANGCRDPRELEAARSVGTAFGLAGQALHPPPGATAGVPEARELGAAALRALAAARLSRRASPAAVPALLPGLAARAEARRLAAGGEPAGNQPLLPLRYWLAAASRRLP